MEECLGTDEEDIQILPTVLCGHGDPRPENGSRPSPVEDIEQHSYDSSTTSDLYPSRREEGASVSGRGASASSE